MRNDICCIHRIAKMHFRKWTKDPRYVVLFLFLLVTEQMQTEGMWEQAKTLGVSVNGLSVFPTMINNQVVLGPLIMLGGILLLFCDAPFWDKNQKAVMIRAKRKRYCMGTILYVFYASVLYVTVIVGVSLLMNIRNLGFSNEWGSYFESVAAGWNQDVVGNLYIPSKMMLRFSAGEAFVYQFVLLLLGTFLFGLIMYYGNLMKKKYVGLLVCSLLIALGQFPEILVNSAWICWISPVNLMKIDWLYVKPTLGYPSVAYAMGVLIVLNLILIVLIRKRFRNIDLTVSE